MCVLPAPLKPAASPRLLTVPCASRHVLERGSLRPANQQLGHEQRHAHGQCVLLALCSPFRHPRPNSTKPCLVCADMFSGALSFNKPLNSWTMSSVTNTECASPHRFSVAIIRHPTILTKPASCRHVLGRGRLRPADRQLGHEQQHGRRLCVLPTPLQPSLLAQPHLTEPLSWYS